MKDHLKRPKPKGSFDVDLCTLAYLTDFVGVSKMTGTVWARHPSFPKPVRYRGWTGGTNRLFWLDEFLGWIEQTHPEIAGSVGFTWKPTGRNDRRSRPDG